MTPKLLLPPSSSMLKIFVILYFTVHCPSYATSHNYGDALRKSLLFFEGQRSGKLPPDQRLKWRRDSALRDGSPAG
ncbi:hypothetical protein MKW94_001714, partial [Papaver nudicaule]|nr:hypothetical protein [Papaver nudicaule]